MPHWFLPLLALVGLAAFFYFGFWRGLNNRADPDNRDSGNSGIGDMASGGDANGHP